MPNKKEQIEKKKIRTKLKFSKQTVESNIK